MVKKSGPLSKDKKIEGKNKVGSTIRKPVDKDNEESILVGKAVKSMMDDVKSGKIKTYSLEEVMSKEKKRRGLK